MAACVVGLGPLRGLSTDVVRPRRSATSAPSLLDLPKAPRHLARDGFLDSPTAVEGRHRQSQRFCHEDPLTAHSGWA
jgi:hypothetical protein